MSPGDPFFLQAHFTSRIGTFTSGSGFFVGLWIYWALAHKKVCDETKLMPMDYLLCLVHYHNALFYSSCLWTSVTLHTWPGLEFVPCFQISVSPLTSPTLYFLLNKCVSVSLTSFICAPGPNLCITWRPFVLCFISHSFDFAASFFIEQMHSSPLHTIYPFLYLLSSECFCKCMASFPFSILAHILAFLHWFASTARDIFYLFFLKKYLHFSYRPIWLVFPVMNSNIYSEYSENFRLIHHKVCGFEKGHFSTP